MSERLDLEAIKKRVYGLGAFDFRGVTGLNHVINADAPALIAEVERLRAALHGSQAGPQESELSWDDLHHGPLTATEGFRRHVKEIAKQLDAHTWTGLMAGFAPADMDFGTTNSGDVGGPVSEKP